MNTGRESFGWTIWQKQKGLPQLNNTLGLSIHEPLRQRIIMNYNIDGYSKEEGCAYIEWKLKKTRCAESIFEDAAIEAVLNASDGAPPARQPFFLSA